MPSDEKYWVCIGGHSGNGSPHEDDHFRNAPDTQVPRRERPRWRVDVAKRHMHVVEEEAPLKKRKLEATVSKSASAEGNHEDKGTDVLDGNPYLRNS